MQRFRLIARRLTIQSENLFRYVPEMKLIRGIHYNLRNRHSFFRPLAVPGSQAPFELLLFGLSRYIMPEKMRALACLVFEISTETHLIMTWDCAHPCSLHKHSRRNFADRIKGGRAISRTLCAMTFGTPCILITMALVTGHFDGIYLNHPPRPGNKRVFVAKLMGSFTRLTRGNQNCVSC